MLGTDRDDGLTSLAVTLDGLRIGTLGLADAPMYGEARDTGFELVTLISGAPRLFERWDASITGPESFLFVRHSIPLSDV